MKTNFDFLFLSSNKRKLYQEDVYNTIASPMKSIIQYRYNLNYLEKELYEGIFNEGHIYQSTLNTYFRNKSCILSYLHTENKVTNAYLFRKGIIKHAIFNSDINKIIFFIELNEFVKINNNSITRGFEKYIINSFESRRSTCVFDLKEKQEVFDELRTAKFFEIADLISPLIPAKLFISITLKEKYSDITNGTYARTITPILDPATNLSRYELVDGSNYYFEILTLEIEKADSILKNESEKRIDFEISSTSDYIDFNQHLLNYGSYNVNYLDIIVKPIPSETVNAGIKFVESETGFVTNILIDIKKSQIRSVLFALSSFMVLATIPLTNLFIKQAGEDFTEIDSIFILMLIVFIFSVISSLRFLYRYFDKK